MIDDECMRKIGQVFTKEMVRRASAQIGESGYVIKADGKKCRPQFVNFNLTSLSRARKFLQP